VRDYEVMKVEQDVPNEFLLVLDDGEHLDGLYEGEPEHKPRRPKGAYYKNIERKMTLKKRRGNVRFFDSPKFINLLTFSRVDGRVCG
jgi:RNA polymerase II-associated factor 1